MKAKILLTILGTAALAIVGCQQQVVTDPGAGYIDLTINWPEQPQPGNSKLVTTFILNLDSEIAQSNFVAPPGITSIEVVVGGPGMSAVSATFDAATGEGTLPGVIAGPNRVARVIARDEQNYIRYAGDSAPFDVNADAVTTVTVNVALVNHAPTPPSNPNPANGAIDVPLQPTFSWEASTDLDKDPITYDFYLGTSSDPPLIASDIADNSFVPYKPGDPNSLDPMTKYYWRVVAKDPYTGTTSPTWSFTTAENYSIDEVPTADAYVDSLLPNTNYGSDPLLWCSDITNPTGYLRNSYLLFDLSGVPSTAYVASATLTIYKNSSNVSSGSMFVACNPVSGGWSEGGITWNNKPNYNSSQQDALEINLGDSAGTAYEFNVTDMVRLMVSGTIPNNGFILRVLAANNAEISSNSRESAQTQYHPRLVVNYTPSF
jgi:hypothetical protein